MKSPMTFSVSGHFVYQIVTVHGSQWTTSGTSLGAVKAGLSQGPPEGLCIGFVFMMRGLFTICVLISVKQTCNACDLINCFDFVLNAPLRTCLKIFLSAVPLFRHENTTHTDICQPYHCLDTKILHILIGMGNGALPM